MKSRKLTSVFVLTIVLLPVMQKAEASPILGVIDIEPIIARHPGIGNSLGLAHNPVSDLFYLAHGSQPDGGYIYTLDIRGNLVKEMNFQAAYRPESYPTSLSFDRISGHLFVFALGITPGVGNVVEMSPDGTTLFNDFAVPLGGGGGIHVRDDGVWQSLFATDTIRHYTRDGTFIDERSVASSFPGFPGPEDLTSSFRDGFFLLDFFGSRVVEVDSNGSEVMAVTTAPLGRFLSIDSDKSTERLFLQNNSRIYTLSSEFIQPIPEPSTLTLFSISLMCILGYAWRQRRFCFFSRVVSRSIPRGLHR